MLGMTTTADESVVSSEPREPDEPVVSSEPREPRVSSAPRESVAALEPVPQAPGFEPGDRLAVLMVLVADDERTLRRLRPIVHRVYGLAHDLTEREALAVAEGLRP